MSHASTGAQPSFAAAIASTPLPQPQSARAPSGAKLGQQLQRQPRRRVRAGAERLARLDDDVERALAGRLPRRTDPQRDRRRSACGRSASRRRRSRSSTPRPARPPPPRARRRARAARPRRRRARTRSRRRARAPRGRRARTPSGRRGRAPRARAGRGRRAGSRALQDAARPSRRARAARARRSRAARRRRRRRRPARRGRRTTSSVTGRAPAGGALGAPRSSSGAVRFATTVRAQGGSRVTSPTCASTPFARAVATAPGSSSIAVTGANPRCAAATRQHAAAAAPVGQRACAAAPAAAPGTAASSGATRARTSSPGSTTSPSPGSHGGRIVIAPTVTGCQVRVPGGLPAVRDRRARRPRRAPGTTGPGDSSP